MEFLRLGEPGREQPAVRHEGTVHGVAPLTGDVDGVFFAAEGIARTREALAAGTLPELGGVDFLRVGPPVARPGAVLCIGQNYAAHAAETGAEPPEMPVLFFKHPNTVVGPYDDVVVSPGADQVDWEVELAVVVGRRAHLLGSVRRPPPTSPGTRSATTSPSGATSCRSPAGSGPRASAARPSTPSDLR